MTDPSATPDPPAPLTSGSWGGDTDPSPFYTPSSYPEHQTPVYECKPQTETTKVEPLNPGQRRGDARSHRTEPLYSVRGGGGGCGYSDVNNPRMTDGSRISRRRVN